MSWTEINHDIWRASSNEIKYETLIETFPETSQGSYPETRTFMATIHRDSLKESEKVLPIVTLSPLSLRKNHRSYQ